MNIRKADLAALVLLLLIVLAVFPPAAFTPSHLLATKYSDAVTQYLPHQLVIRRALLADKCVPLWNPYECSGTPAFPNPLYPTLAFPHLVFAAIAPALALNLGFVLHVFLAGAFAYACARQSGCPRAASLLAAAAYSLCTRSLAHIQAGLYSRMIFFSFIPLLFYCAERCLRRPGRGSAALTGLALAAAILSGAVQLFLYAVPLLVLYAVIRARVSAEGLPPVSSPRRSLSCLAAGILLSLLLTAFYLLPGLFLYPLLTRSRPLGPEALSFMPGIAQLAAILNPLFTSEFGTSVIPPWEIALYAGIVPPVLVVSMFFSRAGRRDIIIWGIPAAAVLLFSLRECDYLHILLSHAAPPLASFRNPARMLAFLPFFISILAARSLRSPGAGAAEAKAAPRRALLCVLLAAACLFFLSLCASARLDTGDLVRNYVARFAHFFGLNHLGPRELASARSGAMSFQRQLACSLVVQSAIIALLSGLVLVKERMGKGRWRGALLLILLCDLLYFSRPYIEAHPLAELYPPSSLAGRLAGEEGRSRLLDMTAPPHASFWPALSYYESTKERLSRIDGYTPVNLESYVSYADRMGGVSTSRPRWSITVPRLAHPRMLSALNGGLVLSTTKMAQPEFSLEAEYRDLPVYRQFLGTGTVARVLLYKNRDALPRAWTVPAAVACGEVESLRHSGRADPRKEVIVPPGSPALSNGEPFREVPVASRGPNRLELRLVTERPCYLVVSGAWAPGWRAEDRGADVPVLRVDSVLRGIYLPAGRHRIVMRYSPPGLAAGTGVSLAALACVIILCLRRGGRGESRSIFPPTRWNE